jgi:hypothetical protein
MVHQYSVGLNPRDGVAVNVTSDPMLGEGGDAESDTVNRVARTLRSITVEPSAPSVVVTRTLTE